MLRNIVAEQKDMNTRIDDALQEAFESRSDLLAQMEELSREALESRADLIEITDAISREAFESRVDYMASLEELEMKIDPSVVYKYADASVSQVDAPELGDIDELELLEQQREKINELVER